MFKSHRTVVAILLIGFALPAAADFTVVTEAYEVALSDLRLPGTTNGTLTFRECGECDYRTIRVTAGTRYEANDETLTLEAFRKAVADLPNPSDITVTVQHHLESDTITGLQVWF